MDEVAEGVPESQMKASREINDCENPTPAGNPPESNPKTSLLPTGQA